MIKKSFRLFCCLCVFVSAFVMTGCLSINADGSKRNFSLPLEIYVQVDKGTAIIDGQILTNDDDTKAFKERELINSLSTVRPVVELPQVVLGKDSSTIIKLQKGSEIFLIIHKASDDLEVKISYGREEKKIVLDSSSPDLITTSISNR